MNNGRCSHGCAKMTFNGITILVVAGGYNGGHLDSVEILDPFFETLIKNNPWLSSQKSFDFFIKCFQTY